MLSSRSRPREASPNQGSAAVVGGFLGSDASGALLSLAGWDLLLGSIAAFYAVMVPYTKVEESFNVQVPVPAPSPLSIRVAGLHCSRALCAITVGIFCCLLK